MDLSNVKIKRINGTKERGAFGNYKVRGPVDDTHKYKMTIYKKQGGEYRKMPYNFPPTDYCKAINNEPYIMPEFAKQSNLTLPIPCPVVNVSSFYLSSPFNQ
jgi:hypothetical protein